MLKITSRLPDVGTTIFDVMTKMANEHGAINLSQGFPDFEIDPKLVSLVNEFMVKGHNQYATMLGVAPLRQIISDVIFNSYGHRVSWETDITVTSGATEGIFACISAFISPGDEVILFPSDELEDGTRVSAEPTQADPTPPGEGFVPSDTPAGVRP